MSIVKQVQGNMLKQTTQTQNPLQALFGASLPTQARSPPKPQTPEQQALDECLNKIKEMEKEAATYNNPENFAKFGKINRQILKMQKELPKLEALAQEAAKTAPPPVIEDQPAP